MPKAIVHCVSPKITQALLTYVHRKPIDYTAAVEQHKTYCSLFERHGVDVIELTENKNFPDSCFVEDTAIVLDEVAVIAQFGVESRRGEEMSVEKELSKHRPVVRIEPPGAFEGGDVVVIANSVFVGLSGRTNRAGFDALQDILGDYGYDVIPVEIRDCLHLKSACNALNSRTLLVNPNWVDLTPFSEFNVVTVDEMEPFAANIIRIGDTVYLHSEYTRTARLLQELEFKIGTLDISEFLKAEGGLSCLSLRIE